MPTTTTAPPSPPGGDKRPRTGETGPGDGQAAVRAADAGATRTAGPTTEGGADPLVAGLAATAADPVVDAPATGPLAAAGDGLAPDDGPALDDGPERVGALAAFESRPFLLFWCSIVLSMTGLWVRITAQGYLVYDLTDDAFLLGLVGFANAAPVLIAAPIAGAVLDRVDRRRVLLAVQVTLVVTAAALGTLVATGTVEVWHIMAIAAVNGLASGFDWPARLSMVPSLVSRRQLQSAVAVNAAAFNVSRIVGPALGGWLIGLIGLAACFYLNAAMYVPFVVVLAGLAVDRGVPSEGTSRGAFGELLEGYRYIWRTPAIRGLLSVDIVPLAFGLVYFSLAPAVARDVLGLGSRGLGVLLAANGIGSLVGASLVAFMAGIRRRGLIVIGGVGLFGVSLIAFAASSNVYASLALILALGVVVAVYATLNDTLVQTLVDEAYRGRVLAVYTMLWGLTPIGALEAGFLATRIGVQWALAINGLVVLAYVPILWRFTPLRRID